MTGRRRERRPTAPATLTGTRRARVTTPRPRGHSMSATTIVYRAQLQFRGWRRSLPRRCQPRHGWTQKDGRSGPSKGRQSRDCRTGNCPRDLVARARAPLRWGRHGSARGEDWLHRERFCAPHRISRPGRRRPHRNAAAGRSCAAQIRATSGAACWPAQSCYHVCVAGTASRGVTVEADRTGPHTAVNGTGAQREPRAIKTVRP